MPIAGITTPVEFATEEWDKLARAWRLLNPSERDQRIREHLDRERDAGRLKLYPELPGWDDFLRLGREPIHLSEADIKARRKRIVARIRQSTTPPTQQAIANVINAIDDVQDLASFAGLVARLVLRAAPRLGVRFVPVLGWIATASDVLNLLGFLTLTAGAALGIRAEGPLGGAAAVAGPAFTKAALKREMWTMLRRSRTKILKPSALSQDLARILQKDYKLPPSIAARHAALLGKRVGLSELLEGAQAVETLTGFGLSLGALMGYLSDAAWAIYRDVSKAPQALIDTITNNARRELQPEFIIRDHLDEIRAVDWSLPRGNGPAFGKWWDRWEHPLHLIHPWVTDATQTLTRAPWCWKATWIQHPDYPREPHSLVGFTIHDQGPGSPLAAMARQQFSQRDLIVTVTPTFNGL